MTNNIEKQPTVDGFKWYGHCRNIRHIRSRITYGGVGIFVKETLLNAYTVTLLDQSYEGILCQLFKDKVSDYCFTVCLTRKNHHMVETVHDFTIICSVCYTCIILLTVHSCLVT